MRKRILAALLCACLLVPALTAPAFAAFPDVPADEWYTEYVDFCTEKGIVNGFEDGTFRPTGYLRRSEFIKMLATSASLTYKSELPGKHWAEAYWAMLSENGVLDGALVAQSGQHFHKFPCLFGGQLFLYLGDGGGAVAKPCRRSNGHFGVRGVGDESDLWHSISSLRVIIFFAAGHRLPSAAWNRPYRSGWSAGGRCPSARF